MDFLRHLELRGYEYLFANAWSNDDDMELVAGMVQRHPLFNEAEGSGPRNCNCRGANRCGTDECPNRQANFECSKRDHECQNQRLQNFRNNNVEPPVAIRNRPGYGLCLYAKRQIQADELIGEMTGQFVSYPRGTIRPASLYAFLITTPESRPLDPIVTLDMEKRGNHFRFASHDCNPSAETFVVRVGVELRVAVKARRVIEADSLVTFNYGFNYFSHGFICHCDSCKLGGGVVAEQARRVEEERQQRQAAIEAARRNRGRGGRGGGRGGGGDGGGGGGGGGQAGRQGGRGRGQGGGGAEPPIPAPPVINPDPPPRPPPRRAVVNVGGGQQRRPPGRPPRGMGPGRRLGGR